MKKLKEDKEYPLATIKITKIREHYKEGNVGCYKDKLTCIEIKHSYGSETSTCFRDTKKGRKELLQFIARELYL